MNSEEKNIISLKKDFMFSEIFNNERNVSKLERFIADYYDFSYEEVHGNLKLIPRELPKNAKREAKKQVDLILELKEFQLKIILEVESRFSQVKKDRNSIYLAKIFSTNYLKGDMKLQNIWKSKQINFSLSNGIQRNFIEEYYFRDKEAKEIYTRVMQIDRVNVQRIHDLEYEKLSKKERVTYDFCKMLESTTEKDLNRCLKTLMNEEEAQDLLRQVIELSGDEEMITLDSEYSDEEIEYYTFMAEKEELEEEKRIFREEKENLKQEQDSFKQEQDSFKQEQDSFKQEQDSFKQEQDSFKQEQDSFEKKKKSFERKKKQLIEELTKFGMSQEDIASLI